MTVVLEKPRTGRTMGLILVAALGMYVMQLTPVEALPDHMRARVMGLMGMFGALAMSLGTYMAAFLVGDQLLLMTGPVLLAVLCSVPLLLGYRDPAVASSDVPPLNLGAMARTFIVNPRKHPNFGWTWLSRFLAGIALSLPNFIVPALAPMLISAGGGHNYALVWVVAAALCTVGGLAVRRIRGIR